MAERILDASRSRDAGLAQLEEHLICNQGVGGSSPSTGTIKSMTYRFFSKALILVATT